MDNHEKLKKQKLFAITLNRSEGPIETISQTLARLKSGKMPDDEQQRIRETFSCLAKDIKSEQEGFLKSRGFPSNLYQAVRVAMADLFGTFVTDEEIDEYSMDKVWDLLQTAYDRRQWISPKVKTAEEEHAELLQKGQQILTMHKNIKNREFCRALQVGNTIGGEIYRQLTNKPKQPRNRN